MFTRQGLRFREVEPEDFELLRRQRNTHWEGYRDPYPVMTQHNQAAWYRTLSRENMAFIVEDNKERVGLLRISQIDYENRSVSLVGCDVFDGSTGKGYATRIMRAAAEWLILELGFHRVKGECMPQNQAMQRALLKAGYVKEGTQRDRIWRDGRWHDFDQYSILEGEL